MLFKRKPKPPLIEAVRLVDRAVLLIHGYWRDRRYRPSEADLRLFLDLEKRLFRSAATARRIALRMERRFHGEPEIDERKWNPRP
jgi:hypothetical protein